MTRVVNIRKDKYDVYIGRSGKGQDGYFGNPFHLNPGHNRGSTLLKYEHWFLNRLEKDIEFRTRVQALEGKVLGCFCKPERCHGDIIVKYLESLNTMQTLPEQFKKNGFDYTLIERSSMTAIYSQSLDGELLAYEVIRVVCMPAGEVFGKMVPEREVLPGKEQWGIRGWTYWDLGKARGRAAELEERILDEL